MTSDFRIAAIQLDTIAGQVAHNVHHAMHWTRRAFEDGARWVVLHEGLTADYTADPVANARPIDGDEVVGFHMLAKRYSGYVALGLNELHEGRPYISTVLIGPAGIAGVYRKTYLWPNEHQMSDEKFAEFLRAYDAPVAGYRLERGVLACGDGTRVFDVDGLRVGCVICADGAHPASWETFARDPRPDLILWQNNRNNVSGDERPQQNAQRVGVPVVATNRVGFSHHLFMLGGSVIVNDAGEVVAAANARGEEEIVWANYASLRTREPASSR